MLYILGGFALVVVLNIRRLLQAELKTIIVFALIWTSGLGLAYGVAQGITLPVVEQLNSVFYLLARVIGW